MRKKLVYIGIVLLIIAIILFGLSSYILGNSLKSNILTRNVTIGPGNYTYLQVNEAKGSVVLALSILLNNSANAYLLNVSQFSNWDNYMMAHRNASGIAYASTIVNSSYIYPNITQKVVPVLLKGNQTNSTGYLVIDNGKGSPSTSMSVEGIISYIPLNSSAVLLTAGLGWGVIILGIAAIIVIVYGAIKSDEPKEVAAPALPGGNTKTLKDQKDQEYVDNLYKGVKSSGKKKAKSKTQPEK
jgi:hypothetical protein